MKKQPIAAVPSKDRSNLNDSKNAGVRPKITVNQT